MMKHQNCVVYKHGKNSQLFETDFRFNGKKEGQYLQYFYDYKKIHMDNCECPYQYRIFHINDVFSNLITHSVCKCCKKIRTIDMMKKEELVKKRKCGLYLASNMSSENVLNVLPNDISKYVVQYI